LPQHRVDHIALNKLTTYRQLKQLSRQGYDIFVNLCEGYLDWDVPSIDVIQSLDLLDLPYTGPPAHLYDPPKALMKYVAYTVDVQTPAHGLVCDVASARAVAARLTYPLFVKPSHAGDSLGIDDQSLAHNESELLAKVEATLVDYDELLVEEFVDGREFTVLVLASTTDAGASRCFAPVEFLFPAGSSFKTYALKTSDLHPSANVPVRDNALSQRLQDAARRVFVAFGGVGYARLDFRMNAAGDLFFLDINFTCSVFYRDGSEGSADYILMHDGIGQAGFAELIIAEGLARHRRRQAHFRMQGNGLSGYGIFAMEALAPGDLVFRGEERAYRLVTRQYVDTRWHDEDRRAFRRYAVPLSADVYALWDEDPSGWSPQNHSCDPNTAYQGLNVVARRGIAVGEELTLDYATILNEQSEPFTCHCGAESCRGTVQGIRGNSVSVREAAGAA
jgi:D-alanine-D-alanine ligase-like ATP-grasp enzyme